MLILRFFYYNKFALRKYVYKFIQMFSYLFFQTFYFFNFFVLSLCWLMEKIHYKKTYYLFSILLFSILQKKFYAGFFHKFFIIFLKYFFFEPGNLNLKSRNFLLFFLTRQPSRRTIISVLRSPFIYKKSFLQFGSNFFCFKLNIVTRLHPDFCLFFYRLFILTSKFFSNSSCVYPGIKSFTVKESFFVLKK